MYELSAVEVEQVSGGLRIAQFAEGAALVGIGCLAIAAAPFALGAAAAIGLGTAGGVSVAGGAWLASTGW